MLVSFLLGSVPSLSGGTNPRSGASRPPNRAPEKQIKPIGQYRGDKGEQVLTTVLRNEPSVFSDALDEFMSSKKRHNSARKLAFLQAYGASPNVRDEKGETALTQAMKRNHVPAIGYLMGQPEFNINQPNVDGQTPLILAVLSRQWDAAEYLLQRGAEPLAKDTLGKTAFDWLAIQGVPEPMDRLLQAAGDQIPEPLQESLKDCSLLQARRLERLNRKSEPERRERIWNACLDGGVTNLFTAMLAYPRITGLREGEFSPLALAAGNGHLAQAKLLLTRGAPVDQPGRSGVTPLMVAAFCGQSEMVRLLLRAGANVERQDGRERTALMLASSAGQVETVDLLLKANANPNASNEELDTALSFAAENGKREAVERLLDCPRLDLSNQGRMAAKAARKAKYPAISELILDRLVVVENRENCGYLWGAWLKLRDMLES